MRSPRCSAGLLMALLLFSGLNQSRAQDSTAANAVLGQWLTTDGLSKVEIYRNENEFLGKIVWLKEPDKDGKPKVDEKNPDETLRSRPVLGMTIMRGLAFDGDDTWKGGKIYDPKSGNDYSAKMTLADPHTLKLRGYIVIPLVGRTEIWTR